MVLNYDCMRAVLLALEDNLTLDEDLRFNYIYLKEINELTELTNYLREDIYYCIYNLIKIDFLDGSIQFADGGIPYHCCISNITYDGHEFLQSIKSESIWKDIKTRLKPIAGLSIPLITEVAKEIIISSLGMK